MEALPTTIQTERLRLRPFRFEDVDSVFAYATDPEWARFLPVPQPYARKDAEQFIAKQVLLDWQVNPAWAIEFGEVNAGGINIRFHYQHRVAEMGYSVAREYWGRGIATEAAQAVIDAAFSTLPSLRCIRATADVRNVGSQRVMEKCGMKREGVLRQSRVVRDELLDEAQYGLLRAEWEHA